MLGIVEVGSSNEMSAVVLEQRVCTGRPLLERKNLRRSVGNCCLSRRWLRKTAFSSILSRMITPMSGSHSNQCFLVCYIRRLRCFVKGRPQLKKNVFFRALPELPKPPPHDPNSGNLVLFFRKSKFKI